VDVTPDELKRLREQAGELERVRAERDAALAQLRQKALRPEDCAAQEAEFARLHAELNQDRQRLRQRIEEFQRRERDLRQAEAYLREQVERTEREAARARAELDEEKGSLARSWGDLWREQTEFRELLAARAQAAKARSRVLAKIVPGAQAIERQPGSAGAAPDENSGSATR
jgi:chromosome segregation ATPase